MCRLSYIPEGFIQCIRHAASRVVYIRYACAYTSVQKASYTHNSTLCVHRYISNTCEHCSLGYIITVSGVFIHMSVTLMSKGGHTPYISKSVYTIYLLIKKLPYVALYEGCTYTVGAHVPHLYTDQSCAVRSESQNRFAQRLALQRCVFCRVATASSLPPPPTPELFRPQRK